MSRVGSRTLIAAACLLAACTSAPSRPTVDGQTRGHPPTATTTPTPPRTPAGQPAHHRWRPAHIVVVIEENHSYREIIGSGNAPYLNHLARRGASLTRFFAITHPSEPNYLALFSGATQGLTGDDCPLHYRGPNLATQLQAAGRSFAGYAEGLPHTGSLRCYRGNYVRRHVPWTNFANVPRSVNKRFRAFPKHYRNLPDVSFVIPNLQHDMHDGTISGADIWLHTHLAGYAAWARTHDSLLVVTWDEDDLGPHNHIATMIVGSHVRPGRNPTHADHYRLLRTVEWLTGLPGIHKSKRVEPIKQVFSR